MQKFFVDYSVLRKRHRFAKAHRNLRPDTAVTLVIGTDDAGRHDSCLHLARHHQRSGLSLAKLAGLAACSLRENRQHLAAFQDINTMLDCSTVRAATAHRESTQNFIDSAQNRHKQLFLGHKVNLTGCCRTKYRRIKQTQMVARYNQRTILGNIFCSFYPQSQEDGKKNFKEILY